MNWRSVVIATVAIATVGTAAGCGSHTEDTNKVQAVVTGKVANVQPISFGCKVTLQPDAGQPDQTAHTYTYDVYCGPIKTGTPYRLGPDDEASFLLDRTKIVGTGVLGKFSGSEECSIAVSYVDASGPKPVAWDERLYNRESLNPSIDDPPCKLNKGDVISSDGPQWTKYTKRSTKR
jgi:hypothetical protein